jgi:hypothetical protein
MMKKMIYKCGSGLGVGCLSTFQNNPALWERCGGMENGLCIEIEVPGDLVNKNMLSVNAIPEKLLHTDSIFESALSNKVTFGVYGNALLTKTTFGRQKANY